MQCVAVQKVAVLMGEKFVPTALILLRVSEEAAGAATEVSVAVAVTLSAASAASAAATAAAAASASAAVTVWAGRYSTMEAPSC